MSLSVTLTDSALCQERNKRQEMSYLYFTEMKHDLMHFSISPFSIRAVELLQSTPSKDELPFALSNFGRALW